MSIPENQAVSAVLTRSPSLSRNIIVSATVYITTVLLVLVVSPITIRTLGDARYGVWSVIAELTGYYGLLDLGIRGAVGYYVAQHASRKQWGHAEGVAASGFWILLITGSTLGAFGSLVAWLMPARYAVAGVDMYEIRTAIVVMSLTVGMTLPMEMVGSVLNAYKRLDVVNLVELITRILNAAAVFIVMKSGGGLIELSLVQAGTKALNWSLNYHNLRRIAPEIHFQRSRFEWAWVRQLASYGGKTMVGNVSTMLTNRSDLTIVALFLGARQVTFLHLGRMMVEYCYAAIRTVSLSFTMHLTHSYNSGAIDEAVRLYLIGTRLAALAAVLMSSYVIAFGKSFLMLWVGPAYVTTHWTQRSDIVMTVLIVGYFPRVIHSMTVQLMIAAGRVTFLMWISIVESVAKLLLAVVLVQYLGLAGIAFSTAFPGFVFWGVMMTFYLFRLFPLKPSRYLAKGIGRPLLVGAAVLPFSFTMTWLNQPRTWPVFGAEALFCFAFGLSIAFWVGITADERRAVLARAAALLPWSR